MALPWSVRELLPHSGSMVLIDGAVAAGDDWITSAVRIAEDSLFYEPGHGVPSWVGIEYMAQTVALYAGLRAKQVGRAISIGLLLGTRRYEVATDYFVLGSHLQVHAREEWQDSQMAIFECHIECAGRIAGARLSVFRPEDARAYLEKQKA